MASHREESVYAHVNAWLEKHKDVIIILYETFTQAFKEKREERGEAFLRVWGEAFTTSGRPYLVLITEDNDVYTGVKEYELKEEAFSTGKMRTFFRVRISYPEEIRVQITYTLLDGKPGFSYLYASQGKITPVFAVYAHAAQTPRGEGILAGEGSVNMLHAGLHLARNGENVQLDTLSGEEWEGLEARIQRMLSLTPDLETRSMQRMIRA